MEKRNNIVLEFYFSDSIDAHKLMKTIKEKIINKNDLLSNNFMSIKIIKDENSNF